MEKKQYYVKSLRTGYYNHARQREESEFYMDEKDIEFDKEGNIVKPSWVELAVEPPVRQRPTGPKSAQFPQQTLVEAARGVKHDVIPNPKPAAKQAVATNGVAEKPASEQDVI